MALTSPSLPYPTVQLTTAVPASSVQCRSVFIFCSLQTSVTHFARKYVRFSVYENDRHRGVGGKRLLRVIPTTRGVFEYRIRVSYTDWG